jgi:hypothetical protein
MDLRVEKRIFVPWPRQVHYGNGRGKCPGNRKQGSQGAKMRPEDTGHVGILYYGLTIRHFSCTRTRTASAVPCVDFFVLTYAQRAARKSRETITLLLTATYSIETVFKFRLNSL